MAQSTSYSPPPLEEQQQLLPGTPPTTPSSIDPSTISASQLPAPQHLLTQSDVVDRHHHLNNSTNSEKPHRRLTSQNSFPTANFNKTGLLGLAALARDRTSSAIASFTEPTLRTRNSTNSLAPGSKSITSQAGSRGSAISLFETERQFTERPVPSRRASQISTLRAVSPEAVIHPSKYRHSLLETNPPSQAYEYTSTNSPLPTVTLLSGNHNKMHQTSSRLLRMTDDERPFTRVSICQRAAETNLDCN